MNPSQLPQRICAAAVLAGFLAISSSLVFARGADRDSPAASLTWDAKAAANYLDQRAAWWITWKNAQRDHDTFCVSCHTAVPYVLARPALHRVLGEQVPNENERVIFENVTKRVRMWKEILPPYNDKDYGANKEAESRATEAVLLAFLFANHDAPTGKLSDDTRAAFDHLWALQQTDGPNKGAWLWQMFDLNPWEGNISAYHGATLAAVAAGAAPENYRAAPEIQRNMAALRDYLEREYSAQPLLNRVTLLWASTKVPGLIAPDRQKSIIEELSRAQQEDGGWSLFSLAKTWRDWSPSAIRGEWKRKDQTPQDLNSDGYATALAVFVLQQTGIAHDDERVRRGRAWLLQHQNKT
ncbi:MAG TPA: hypothetical protein VLC94_09200, partial [Candidatus Acidoferrum sp.]|nr:hypothetical protein [Candidatus Acidoferrum sp.]